jgi:HD-like signal output (HDOD) protein/CheY-like chemotaxis protein
VLFVDDEPGQLDELRRLAGQGQDWDASYAVGADEALAVMGEAPVDVLVADLDMPGMDGAELLAETRERHPQTVRILRSSRPDDAAAVRAVPVAHQVVGKPTDGPALAAAIRRAMALRELLGRDALREAVGQVDTLPSPPGTWLALTKVLDDPGTGVADIAQIVRQDPAMSAKLLQLVNSSFASLNRRLSSVDEAVVYLGPPTVRSLALSVGAFKAFPTGGRIDAGYFDRLAAHGALCAELASTLVDDRAEADHAFAAGLLQDVGQLVLAANLPDAFAANLDLARERGEPLHQVEQDQGYTHAHVGAYLLGLWGLPPAVVDAVARHHDPPDQGPGGGPVGAVEATQLAISLVEPDDQAGQEDDERVWTI